MPAVKTDVEVSQDQMDRLLAFFAGSGVPFKYGYYPGHPVMWRQLEAVELQIVFWTPHPAGP